MTRVVLAVLLLCAASHALALGRLAEVEILDRDTGLTLPVYRAHGEYWVAGNPGARYAIVIHNLRGERLLAVTSVDGVNVLSGETAAWDQSGYVLHPDESYAIDGWRKSRSEVADFNFTALPASYAARTGRPGNVGIIGVALFRERVPVAAQRRLERSAPLGEAEGAQARAAPSAAEDAMAPARQLGTGHGERETSLVSDTQFDRAAARPDELLRIRYDRYDNLVAMGVVRVRWQPPTPDAFPDSSRRFVPDPPGGF